MLKVIRATRKSMSQFQGPILRIWAKFPDQNWKNKNATFINALKEAYSGIEIFYAMVHLTNHKGAFFKEILPQKGVEDNLSLT